MPELTLEQAEARIRSCIKADLELGYRLIAGINSKLVWERAPGAKEDHKVYYRCALACTLDPGPLESMEYRAKNVLGWTKDQMMAFVYGWDGEQSRDPMDYWELGRKLRKEFKPKDD